jgi:hypothetical protein
MNDNKFKVGQEVIYDSPVGMKKVDIFGYIYCEKDNTWLYAIKLPTNKHVIVREDTLSKLKKKDELEAGDVCKQKGDNRLKILCRANDEYSDEVTYFIKHITGKRKGLTDVIPAETIKEIFYE